MLTDHDWTLIEKAADAMGLMKDTPRKWRERNRIPGDRLPELARRTKIPMRKLRPDLFANSGNGAPPSSDAAA